MSSNQSFDIPILLITFNRPETTAKVLDKISLLSPEQLFIFSDGPRLGGEDDRLVMECRELVDKQKLPQNCKINKWFSADNMGCGLGPSSAISWAFQNVDKLIILEDDCIPDPSFFTFCKAMLEKYDKNEIVMHIAGTRWNPEYNTGPQDHFFSKIGHIWGWATWKRAWTKYNFNIKGYDEFKSRKVLNGLFQNQQFVDYWHEGFEYVLGSPSLKIWDYQWQYTLFANNGLSVVPNVNLVTNIGINGIHYNGEKSEHLFRKINAWAPTPDQTPTIASNDKYDDYHMYHRFLKKPPIYIRALKKIRRMFSKPVKHNK